mmetsp:Transcript_8933/g.19067  ORF Transcript_8933/g.19067 Transcript_8933/m.19067 type:complete len:255 (+) Transcript_8933:82-846(+)
MDLLEKNKAHFDKQAATYDEKPYIRDWASSSFELVKERTPGAASTASCLDFGSGTGALSELLSTHFNVVVGLDVSGNMTDRYNNRAASRCISNMHGVHANILEPLEVETKLIQHSLPVRFDFIISQMTFHHVEKPHEVVASLKTLLKPGGQLAIVDLHKTDNSKLFHGRHAHHSVAHLGGFDERYMEELYRSNGLELKEFIVPAFVISKEVEVPVTVASTTGGEGVASNVDDDATGYSKQVMEFSAFMALAVNP